MRIDMRHYFGHITVSFMMTLNKTSVLGNYKCVPLAVLFQSVFWLKSTSKNLIKKEEVLFQYSSYYTKCGITCRDDCNVLLTIITI